MSVRTVALTGLAMLVAAAPAQAATFTVSGTADTVGVACTGTVCPTVRTAIAAANANGAATDDVIVLPAGTYAVNTQLGALSVPTGATRITLQGAGANTTFIQPPAGVRALVIGTSAGVTVTGLTFRSGAITSGQGGNVLVSSQATATFNRVRITGGSAPQGGGIAVLGATTLTIQSSLIDANSATGTAGVAGTGVGGGLYVQGQTTGTQITIQDTTIVSNSADNGGGIGMENNAGQPPTLRGVTLARNNARAGQVPGVGGISSGGTNARFQGSIVAGNTRTINLGGGSQTQPANCGLASAATDDGGNVTPDTDQCGLGGVHTDPQLAAALDASQPPALTIPANSSAVNIAVCAPRTVDQRGVTRPQGTACDAGAYEVDQAPTVTITSGPSGTVASSTASFGFATTEPGVTLQCKLDRPGQPGTFATCTSPTAQSYVSLSSGAYTFSVRALDGTFANPPVATRSFTVDAPVVLPQATPTPAPSATPAPGPLAGVSVGARPVSGKVLVKVPGAKTFVPLDPSVLKNGAEVDTRGGVVEITRSDGGVARFYDGIFKLSQSGGITTLTLTEKLTGCPKARRSTARAAAKKPKTRKLWGDGKGKFRTKGSYSAATVRGTKWLVQDTCTTTLTRVATGVVAVEDFAKHKTTLVKQGRRYTARPKR
jgi:hypothetical protein